MIKFAIFIFVVVCSVVSQDALLTPSEPFSVRLREPATYHQSFLIEVDPQQYSNEWASVYAHQATSSHSVVDLEFGVVQKQYPERQGHVLARCRLEDQARRWCKIEAQGLNLHHHLIKVTLDCVSDCTANLTIGFAHSQWDGQSVPRVMGSPLQVTVSAPEQSSGSVLFKIIGWMVFTLVLVLLAIQFGQKIANKYDAKMQEDRMNSLKERRIPAPQTHKKSQ